MLVFILYLIKYVRDCMSWIMWGLAWIRRVLLMAMLLMVASANGTEAGLPVVRVALDLWPGYYPVVIAQKQGYFAKRGLQVDYTIPENTDQMLEAFAAGKVDVVCVALGDVFAFRERVPSLRVVMLSDESAGGDALVSLKPLPQTLKGLRVGTNLNGFGELFVRAFVRQQNASMKDIVLVNQEASKAAIMLSEGKVDVAHTWEPYVSELTSYNDATVVFTSERTPGLIPDAVVMHGNLLQQPEQARAFVAAWLEAAEWWLTHRHAGNRIAERALLLMPNTVNLEGIRLFDGKANRAAFQKSGSESSIFQTTQLYIDYFREKGVIKSTVTPDDVVTSAYLP